jgi:hypothetical protein
MMASNNTEYWDLDIDADAFNIIAGGNIKSDGVLRRLFSKKDTSFPLTPYLLGSTRNKSILIWDKKFIDNLQDTCMGKGKSQVLHQIGPSCIRRNVVDPLSAFHQWSWPTCIPLHCYFLLRLYTHHDLNFNLYARLVSSYQQILMITYRTI